MLRIAEVLRQKKVGQRKLAIILGVSWLRENNIVMGMVKPTPQTLASIASTLGVSIPEYPQTLDV